MLFVSIIILLILINGYFSAIEIALVSIKKFKIQKVAANGDKRAKVILQLLKKPDQYLSSIQVGITLAGIIEGMYGGRVLQTFLQPRFMLWGLSSALAHILSVIIGIGSITFVTIVIGELLPKSIALQSPQKIGLAVAPSFKIFTFLVFPIVKVLTKSTEFLAGLLHIRGSENQKLTDSDLKGLLSLAYRQGILEKTELALHENIFNFYEGTVEKIMTPYNKIVLIEETMRAEVVEEIIRKSTHTYFPIVRQKNKVVGYLNAKEFFLNPGKNLKEISYKPCTIELNQTAPALLQKFKKTHHNFSMVINKNIELLGIVTMHDIGEILTENIN